MVADVVASSRFRAVLVALALYLAYQVWLSLAAPGKISPALAGTSEKVNIRIETPFTPERFHVQMFQKYGRIAGADDHSVDLRGVRRSDLDAVARPYWVTRVGPINEGG